MPISGDVYAQYTGRLSGNMKTVYASGGIKAYFPASAPLLKEIGGMSPAEKVGNDFVWPLGLSFSQGQTYARAGAGAFPFRPSRPGTTAQARVNSVNVFHRISSDWETLERAKDGNGNIPDGAFEDAAKRILRDLRTGCYTRLEESFWYAGTNNGIFLTGSASSQTVDYGDGRGNISVLRASVTYDTWASYMWLGKEGAPMDFFATTNRRPTTGTPINNSATFTLPDNSTTNTPMVFESLRDLNTFTVEFSGPTADISALVSAINGAGSAVGVTYWGQVNNDTRGLEDVITNPTSTLIYGLNPLRSPFLRGQTYDNGNQQLTYRRLMRALKNTVALGAVEMNAGMEGMGDTEGSEGFRGIDCWLSPQAWEDLIASETALLRRSEAGGKVTQGYAELTYMTQVGPMRFIAYNRIKQGQAFVLPTKRVCKKVGAADLALKDWGDGSEKYLRQLEGVAGVEAAMYGNVGLYLERPAWCLNVTGVRASDYATGT